MTIQKIHLTHVGTMTNKGTQALVKSDVLTLKKIIGSSVSISISTADIDGVKKLGLPVSCILPFMLDIPYEKADYYSNKYGFKRENILYKLFAVSTLFFVPIQMVLSVINAILVKHGLKAFYRGEELLRIKESDIIISCSDENYREGSSLLTQNAFWILTWWSMLIPRTWEILISKYFKKPVVIFPNSIGPFQTWFGRFLSRLSINSCDAMLVRDPLSLREVTALNVRTPRKLTTDIAFLFESTINNSFDKKEGPILAVSAGFYSRVLSDQDIDNFVTLFAHALDKAIEKHGFQLVLLPHYVGGFQFDDLHTSKLIFAKLKNSSKAKLINAGGVDEFKALLSNADMVISSKMHPGVLSLASCVPTLTIAYDQKQTGFLTGLGISDCCLPLLELSENKLSAKIDYVWQKRSEIRSTLNQSIPILKENSLQSIKSILSPFMEI